MLLPLFGLCMHQVEKSSKYFNAHARTQVSSASIVLKSAIEDLFDACLQSLGLDNRHSNVISLCRCFPENKIAFVIAKCLGDIWFLAFAGWLSVTKYVQLCFVCYSINFGYSSLITVAIRFVYRLWC
jgi:hypothetical protein